MDRNEQPDEIVITLEPVREERILRIAPLPLTISEEKGVAHCREAAVALLAVAGVSDSVARNAVSLLEEGAAGYGAVMRGGVVMDAMTGERLEPDSERGIRVSHFDWEESVLSAVEQRLVDAGLGHFRTKEALALASKAAQAPGMVAELCWSDDPDYTAGYVASQSQGYCRFDDLKARGSRTGGRVFFVTAEGCDLGAFREYLEKRPVLIGHLQVIRGAVRRTR